MITRRTAACGFLAAAALPFGAFAEPYVKPWSRAVEDAAEPLLMQLFQGEFVKKIAAGTLPRESFCYYLQQNRFYLLRYAKSLSMLAARLPRVSQVSQVTQYASDTIEVYHWNREMLEKEDERLWMGRPWSKKEMPAPLAYASFEAMCVATEPTAVAWASLLPCFWVYDQLGLQLQTVKKAGNPYSEWIDALTTPEYHETVRGAMHLADVLADGAAGDVRERMTEAFLTSCRMEERFFNAALRLETW
jgi:thiaminase/transcriptional activator TenA